VHVLRNGNKPLTRSCVCLVAGVSVCTQPLPAKSTPSDLAVVWIRLMHTITPARREHDGRLLSCVFSFESKTRASQRLSAVGCRKTKASATAAAIHRSFFQLRAREILRHSSVLGAVDLYTHLLSTSRCCRLCRRRTRHTCPLLHSPAAWCRALRNAKAKKSTVRTKKRDTTRIAHCTYHVWAEHGVRQCAESMVLRHCGATQCNHSTQCTLAHTQRSAPQRPANGQKCSRNKNDKTPSSRRAHEVPARTCPNPRHLSHRSEALPPVQRGTIRDFQNAIPNS
jgi:hypothetical protein